MYPLGISGEHTMIVLRISSLRETRGHKWQSYEFPFEKNKTFQVNHWPPTSLHISVLKTNLLDVRGKYSLLAFPRVVITCTGYAYAMRLRLSDYDLMIEKGRKLRIDRDSRTCKICKSDKETKVHFIFQCPKLDIQKRERFTFGSYFPKPSLNIGMTLEP